MNVASFAVDRPTLREDKKTYQRLLLNYSRNKKQDHTAKLDAAASAFDYTECADRPWNPESFSLMYGTPLWDGSTEKQRVLLNQLYWLAYYSQIISAEIATIYYNQTSAAGLYALEDFRLVCDTLDLESTQERAHIHAFRSVSDSVEASVFGERVFSYAMRGPFASTMIYSDLTPFRERWRQLQLRTYGMLSSGSAFIACQYFTVRGLRTLNGKMIQHELALFHDRAADPSKSPIPSAISAYHFQDESYHFNSSMLISQDVLKSLKPPTPFEQMVVNMTIKGCQKDHAPISVAIRGIFWHDPALFPKIYKLLRSAQFGMEHAEALDMMRRCFCEETPALHESHATHKTAVESYRTYVDGMDYLTRENREMSVMAATTTETYLAENRAKFARFAS